MRRWTVEEDETIKANCHLGAHECRNLIHEEFGIYRTVEATKKRAYRLGLSLFSYEICPECGRKVKTLKAKTGCCDVCNLKKLTHDQFILNKELKRQLKENDGIAARQAKREYDQIRQENYRLKKAYKERCRDFV